MKVLVVGGGGREHTFVWKIAQSPLVDKVYCAPGNAGIAQIAECVDISLEGINMPILANFAWKKDIDLVVVGPEAPLADGIVDYFEEYWSLNVFGPSQKAAEIEANKAWSKQLMWRKGIPTAKGRIFTNPKRAREYVKEEGAPIVVKASGLAAGKGVRVCETESEALKAIQDIMVKKIFGDAGNTIVIEERLYGEEATFTAFTDGETILPTPTSQDHKPISDGDEGLNTGGMGAYSPAPVVNREMRRRIMDEIMYPAVHNMDIKGRKFTGILYAGLMITAHCPKVLEFNCRLGDPEAQVILPRLESDLVPALQACIDGTLHKINLKWKPKPAVCVVMASGGYPEEYETGKPIFGLIRAEMIENVKIFHAGTAANKDGQFITNGGRVLGITALGDSIQDAINRAYAATGKIFFDKVYYRKDIGNKALKRN